jgi:hypothetical protein
LAHGRNVGILCSFSLEEMQAMISSGDPVFSELTSPSWRFVELPTGHYPMFSRPDDLAAVFLDLPSGSLLERLEDVHPGE